MKINQTHEQFEDLLRKNFLALAPAACIIYPLLGFVDYSLVKKDLQFFLLLRILFIIPTLLGYLWLRKKGLKQVKPVTFTSFLFSGMGVAVISYYLGGISSDYYFGLLIVSFLQFTFVPLELKWSVFLDLFYVLFFFWLNTFDRDFQQDLLVKQLSNYLSFVVFKFVAITRSRKHIFDSFEKIALVKELKAKTNIQYVFGELCHLINNPLFISQTVTKKAIKELLESGDKEKIHHFLSKSLVGQKRIEAVIDQMLKLQQDKEVDIEEYKFFLKIDEENVKEKSE